MSVDWDSILKQVIDNNTNNGNIIDNRKKQIILDKLVSGYYTPIKVNIYSLGIYDLVPTYSSNTTNTSEDKIKEYWKDLEELLVVDIGEDNKNSIRNSIISSFAMEIELDSINNNIFEGLPPDILIKMFAAYIDLFNSKINDRLYFTSEDILVALSLPLKEIIGEDEEDWDEADLEGFIIYPDYDPIGS